MTTVIARDEWLERGRRCVFGYLCPMILHETNNVLTVMAGIRQILGQGRPISDRIGPMLDSQLTKMDELLSWVHGMSGAVQLPSDDGVRTTEHLAKNLKALIALAAKGRKLQIRERGGADPITGVPVEALSFGLLCSLLPMIPQRIPGAPTLEIDIEVAKSDAGFRLLATMQSVTSSPQAHPEVDLARSLVRGCGGTFSSERTSEHLVTVELEVPEGP